jgi:hypothetical protein
VEWAIIVNAAEENEANYCKGLHGKTHFIVLYGLYSNITRVKDRAQGELPSRPNPSSHRETNNAGGWFPGSTEVEAARRRNCRNFEESVSVDQNVARLKHASLRRSSSETFSLPPSGQRAWTPTLPVLRPLQMKRQLLAKEIGRAASSNPNVCH